MTTFTNSDREFGRRRLDQDLELAIRPDHVHRKPRLATPCTEPLIRASNILRDPGFELHQGLTGKSEIPELDVQWTALTWQDSAVAPNSVGWANQAYTNASFWDISTLGEESGTYSARIDGTEVTSTELAVIGLIGCDDGEFYSGRCTVGDFTRAACRAIVDSVTGTPNILINMEWYAQDGSFIDSADLSDTPLTTSYATYETIGIAPSTSYYLRVYYSVSNEQNRVIYLDNAILEVA